VESSAAARLAERISAAVKSQGLNGETLAQRVERLTGAKPSPMAISRWRRGLAATLPMVSVSPHLVTLARALDLDPHALAVDVVRHEIDRLLLEVEAAPNPRQSADCLHPNLAGTGCPACCDTCNGDRHVCDGCGQPTGHEQLSCPECADEVQV